MDVSENLGTPKSSILIRFSIINQLVVSKIFYVHIFTLIVGEMIQVDLPIFFQMGWFNHQLDNIISGQIIATSHDLTPNGGLVREIPLFQGNLGW